MEIDVTENLALIDVSHQRDPHRSLVRNLSVGDRVQLVMSRGGAEGSPVEAKIRAIEGDWPDRIFLGDCEPSQHDTEWFYQWDGVVAFRPRHIFAAWPQPAGGWEQVRDDLRQAIVDAIAGELIDESAPLTAALAVLEEMVQDATDVQAEIELAVSEQRESAQRFHEVLDGPAERA